MAMNRIKGGKKNTISHSHYFETDGEWKEMDVIVDMNLHKAIHQVLLEHGWL